jgi:Helix-turn-helix domain
MGGAPQLRDLWRHGCCTGSWRWIIILDGQRLRDLRRRHGLSQVELGRLAGISPYTVAKMDAIPYGPAAPERWPA